MTIVELLTDWQGALVTLLSKPTPDGLGMLFRGGERDGPSMERDVGCVFSPGWQEDSGDVGLAHPAMIVRAWLRYKKEPSQDVPPRDPADMYKLAGALVGLLEPVQTTLLAARPGFYFRVSGVRIDHADQGIEATLLGTTLNAAAIPISP